MEKFRDSQLCFCLNFQEISAIDSEKLVTIEPKSTCRCKGVWQASSLAWGRALTNSPRSIYQNSNMTSRLSDHFSLFGLVWCFFGLVFFVLTSLLGIARQRSRKKFAILTLKPRSHVRILIYQTWAIRG